MCMQSELMQMSYRDPNSKDESSPSGLNRGRQQRGKQRQRCD